jgi:dihydrofolate reductase
MWNVVTLDGFFDNQKPWDLDFHQTIWGDELEAYSIEQLESADMLVFGKNTYEGMASYWATEKGEVAEHMNKIQKIACSTTLKSADWNNSLIIRDAVAEIPELKQQGDGNMFVFGSGNLSESLIKAALFDEYRLCVAPVFLGAGKLLFKEGLPYQKLSLIKERRLQSGGVILMYATTNK